MPTPDTISDTDIGPSRAPLSVVMITRNQAWNVDRLIESVCREVDGWSEVELILVDSSSTDGTAELAARHPVRVLRIDDGEYVGPAAGRYLGYLQTSGRYVLFLDGDTEMYPGWLENGLEYIDSHPEVAVVSGSQISVPIETAPHERPVPSTVRVDWKEAPHGGGIALYRRSVLEEVGTFNPWLRSDEEPELCIRIRHAGYKVMRTSSPIVYEYQPDQGRIRTVLGRWRRDLYIGAGQSLRVHFGRPTFAVYLRERGFGLLPLGILASGFLAAGVSAVLRDARPVSAWFGLLLVGIGVLAVKRRRLRGLARSLLLRLVIADGTLRGFVLGAPPANEYRPSYRIVRGGSGDGVHAKNR